MPGTPVNTEQKEQRPASENVAAPQAVSLVLHIRPDLPGRRSPDRSTALDWEADSVDALLESASLRVAACPDVYRGLARLLSAASQTPAAVIVCVDELGPREMEFFSIVSRRRPGLLVYVYGRPRFESRLTQAVGLGAAGRVTEEAILRLAAADTPPPVQESHEQPPSKSVAADKPVTQETFSSDEPPLPRQPAQPGDRASADLEGTDVPAVEPPAADSSRGGEDSEPQPSEPRPFEPQPIEPQPSEQVVRVPWLRYADRPARTGPRKPPPLPTEDPTESAPEGPPRELPEPLLTDEELRALIGEDDIAALAPEPGDPFPPATPFGEGRES